MLQELRITNFALIDEVLIEFGPGLNILTGETGAGKTILLQALGLLLGGRADASVVRGGRDELRVEGRFGTSGDDELILARVVSREGKSKCYANGSLITLSAMGELSDGLVDLHGQHEHQALLRVSSHIDYLDRFCGAEQMATRQRYEASLAEVRDLHRQMAELEIFVNEKRQRRELLEFQVGEIEAAVLSPGEETQIAASLEILRNAERLASSAAGACNLVASEEEAGALETVRRAVTALGGVKGVDGRLDELATRLESCCYELEEIARDLREYGEAVQFDPGALAQAEERMAAIGDLKRKYGQTIESVLEYGADARGELARLDTASDDIDALQARLKSSEKELAALAKTLSAARKEAASRFSKDVGAQMARLGMAQAELKVRIGERPGANGDTYGPAGIDEVEFLFAPNKGEPTRPLAKIASGGEISRVMLAAKIVLGAADDITTLVFDEVDSGIGGKTAAAVGAKLAELAASHQVICVTHLPQIASCGHKHLRVTKAESGGRTASFVEALDEDARVTEIARMLSGPEVSESSIRHAKELLCSK